MSEELMDSLTEENIALKKEEDLENHLIFMSDGLYFGVSTKYVSEIITNYAFTELPMVPSYIKGIINLRGAIIPIIDIRMRMNKPTIEYNSSSCIIVLEIDSVSVGIIVDSVTQVIDLDLKKSSPAPANNQQELVNGMMTLPDGTVILFLDCQLLVKN